MPFEGVELNIAIDRYIDDDGKLPLSVPVDKKALSQFHMDEEVDGFRAVVTYN